MNTIEPQTQPAQSSFRFTQQQSIALVCGCTVLGAGAQILMKTGANVLVGINPIDILANPPLFAGYCLYGLSTVLLVLALRDGELSILYPVISLSYVWVTILSVWFFDEQINPLKVIGVSLIVAGVAVFGRNKKP